MEVTDDERGESGSALLDKRAKLGMKVVSRANWLSPDPVALFSTGGPFDDEAGVVQLVETGNYLAERFTEFDVSPQVSEEAARLFHVARGVIVYAVFFYPLFEIGLERAYSAVEIATKDAAAAHAIPSKRRDSHAHRTDWLCEFGWIDRQFCGDLHDMRWLRNHAVHERQSIVGPPEVSRRLYWVKRVLEKLANVRDAAYPEHIVPGDLHDHYARPWQ